MRVVAALGGNALLERGETPEADIQRHHVQAAVSALAPLAADHQVVVTHGNGPQVGVLAAESARDPAVSRPYPFDVLVAQTQGMIGYWLVQCLENELPGALVAGIVSQTLVDPDDPAMCTPSKFVGPALEAGEASRLARDLGWSMALDGEHWRRVVASPEPSGIVELDLIELLVNRGATVVCAGGGGVPVARDEHGLLAGVAAVVDKDLTSALLAIELGADALVLLTDVQAVQVDFATPSARALPSASVAELRARSFTAGSMGPKVEAACRFVETTGGRAAIGRLEDAAELLAGRAGTMVTP